MTRVLAIVMVLLCPVATTLATETTVEVFADEPIHWVEERPEAVDPDGYVIRHAEQSVVRTVSLPSPPVSQSDARRIVAVVEIEPIYSRDDGKLRPNDPWTRLGNVSVEVPDPDGEGMVEAEILRFITPYGAPATYEQDVTPLAPLLHGRQTIRAFISSYSDEPGWRISLTLRYTKEGVGQRRPVFARHLFTDLHVGAADATLKATVTIPEGLDQPRLRIITTGHATDGMAENEFVTCDHMLRVDGRLVSRWRPWAEGGGTMREANPWAGRRDIDGREIRSSDFDRSGWTPGKAVEPLMIPLPELTPGEHEITVQVLGIRPKGPVNPDDGKRHHGYFCISAFVVADEPWPEIGAAESGDE
jgi:hypothetical protein